MSKLKGKIINILNSKKEEIEKKEITQSEKN